METGTVATKQSVPLSALGNSLLLEAALLSADAFTDSADSAVARGWSPVSLPGLEDGVQRIDLGLLAPIPDQLKPITSAMHVYEGSLEGRETLAVAFRGTDEGDREFAFQGASLGGGRYGWDLYLAAHAQTLGAALTYAAAQDIDQLLITGVSLGGIVAELATHELAAGPALASRTVTVTFGSPGSVEPERSGRASEAQFLNVVHSDDFVARLSDLSPVFQAGGAHREGVDVLVSRREATLPDFSPEDLDTPEEIFAAALDPTLKIEHQVPLYVDTARVLAENEHLVPGVANHPGDPLRWLRSELDRFVLGTEGADVLEGSSASEFLAGQAGADRIDGGAGHDVLAGGGGNDIMQGGDGADRLDGGTGDDVLYDNADGDFFDSDPDDLIGGRGMDILYADTPGDLLGRDRSVRGRADELDGGERNDQLFGDAGGSLISESSVPERSIRVVGGADDLDGGSGDDRLFGDTGVDFAVGARGTILGGDDALLGGRGYDRLYGDAGGDMFVNPPDPAMVASVVGGNDSLLGGAGNDRIYGDAGGGMSATEGSFARAGHDRLEGNEGADILVGDALHLGRGAVGGNDRLSGGDGNDRLYGDAGNMVEIAGGDDTLFGGRGNDVLHGGKGDDIFVVSAGNDRVLDFVAGAGSEDRLDIRTYFSDAEEALEHAEQVGGNTVFTFSDGMLTLRGVSLSSLHADDFI